MTKSLKDTQLFKLGLSQKDVMVCKTSRLCILLYLLMHSENEV